MVQVNYIYRSKCISKIEMGVFLINLSTQFKRRKKKCFNSYKTVTTSREISPFLKYASAPDATKSVASHAIYRATGKYSLRFVNLHFMH